MAYRHLTVLPALVAGLAGAAQSAAGQEYHPYGAARGWTVEAVTSDGSFMRCEARNPAAPFALVANVEGWMVTVMAPAGLPDEVSGYIDVDRASLEATFYRMDDGSYGAFLDDGAIDAIRSGSHLSVDLGGGLSAGSLSGSTAAMGKLQECVERGGLPPKGGALGQAAPAPVAPVESDAMRLGDDCPAFGDYVSPASDVPAHVRFYNASDIAVSLYWIDFDGQIVEYAGTLPGESYEVDSYVGHYWLAKDFDGTCHGGVIEITDGLNYIDIP